jgi:hypothetical protein
VTALGVVIDGEALPATEAIAMWQRFSAYMDEHKGDLAGFAKQEGFASVHPAMEKGLPVLVASRSAAQKAYASVERNSGGSSGHQVGRGGSPSGRGRSGKPGKRR